jgi:hypothetical protein
MAEGISSALTTGVALLNLTRIAKMARGRRPKRRAAAVAVLLAAAVGGLWAVNGDDDGRSPDQRIIDTGREIGAHTRTDTQILEVADIVCASLRRDKMLPYAHGTVGRQLLLGGKNPRSWMKFVLAAIDNRCPDVDDAGLYDGDKSVPTKDYR